MPELPPLLDPTEIQDRLKLIFPEGSPNRAHAIWQISARTIFVMLYVGAVEGNHKWIRPDQVARMADSQSGLRDEESRVQWSRQSLAKSTGEIPGRWFASTTRESIRDDTIRFALIPNGAVVEREGLPTTSPAPRYALQKAFAALFDPAIAADELIAAIDAWRSAHLTPGAIARIAIRRRGAVAEGDHVLVRFPSGETRRLAPGPSSTIAKLLIESFAPRFLGKPGVIWMSESRNKVVARDEDLARSIGLNIQPDQHLPDVILVDLEPVHPILVFVEVVATDGPVSPQRKAALTEIATGTGFPATQIAFVTAYLDRSEQVFKRTVDSLAWGTFVWFASEPDSLLYLYAGEDAEACHLSMWP